MRLPEDCYLTMVRFKRRTPLIIGTAFNQLAVISTYMSDDFQTAYYYFRALAVRSPFKNGEEITDKFLKKVFERSGQEQDLDQVGLWKRDFVLVVSVIYRKSG